MHEVCEYKIRHDYFHDRMKKPQSDEYYTDEVEQVTDVYAEFVIGIIEEMKANGTEPLSLVEEKLDYSHVAPDGFGTGDMVVIGKNADGKGLLHIVDFKGGRGVFVEADHNPQMMLYAIGALHAYNYIYNIEVVRMSIVQPRLDNISTCEMSVNELNEWAESIKPIAKLAYEGKGEQKPGDWCRFCKAKSVCRACMDEALSLAQSDFVDLDALAPALTEQHDDLHDSYSPDTDTVVFKSPSLVSIEELAAVLPTLNRISAWIEAVFSFLSSEAINHGTHVPGYKVVEGRSKRVFTDVKSVVDTAIANGYTDLYKQELITLTEFEKMMGKKKFAELLGEYVAKPPGKLALVPESDSRPPVELNPVSAADEFELLDDGIVPF